MVSKEEDIITLGIRGIQRTRSGRYYLLITRGEVRTSPTLYLYNKYTPHILFISSLLTYKTLLG